MFPGQAISKSFAAFFPGWTVLRKRVFDPGWVRYKKSQSQIQSQFKFNSSQIKSSQVKFAVDYRPARESESHCMLLFYLFAINLRTDAATSVAEKLDGYAYITIHMNMRMVFHVTPVQQHLKALSLSFRDGPCIKKTGICSGLGQI